MTTLTTSLNRLIKSLFNNRFHLDTVDGFVPPQVLEGVVGVLFIKDVPRNGKMNQKASSGMLLAKMESGKWTLPVAVHFESGTCTVDSKLNAGRGSLGLLVLIRDPNVVSYFREAGAVNFGQTILRGEVIPSPEPFHVAEFEETVKTQGRRSSRQSNYSYAITKSGKIGRVHLEDAVMVVRRSSNYKFYFPTHVDLQTLMSSSFDPVLFRGNIVHACNSLDEFLNVESLYPFFRRDKKQLHDHKDQPAAQNQQQQPEEESERTRPDVLDRQMSFEF